MGSFFLKGDYMDQIWVLEIFEDNYDYSGSAPEYWYYRNKSNALVKADEFINNMPAKYQYKEYEDTVVWHAIDGSYSVSLYPLQTED